MQILVISTFLSAFGLFNLFGLSQPLFFRQLIYVVIAFSAYFLVKSIGRHFFKANSMLFYWIMMAILIITYVVGLEVKGSRRWLDLYFFNFQVSEFFKVFMIMFLAKYFSERKILENNFLFFLKSFMYVGIPALIIFKQPDLGNAAVYGFFYLVILIFSPHAKKHLSYLLGLSAILAPIGWLLLKTYQKARILSFLNPHLDTQGTAYNMIQAVITIGSGKFMGRGLGLSTQSRLYFLPENTTDFAFAALVEQLGFVGGITVIAFYAALIYFIARRASKYFHGADRENREKFLYCIGILSYLLFQIFVNIGMNMGLLPITGVALPFVSYGGSAVLALLIGLALIP
jgi:rod shape determining protein RodA